MRYNMLLARLAAAFVFLTPAVANDPVFLTVAQIESDVALAKDAYSRLHPGYSRYASTDDMDAAWQAIIDDARAGGGMTLSEFYLAIELALVNIRCDHTKAELPKQLRDQRKVTPLYLPFRWDVVEGRALVADPAGTDGLAHGDEIMSIDGRPMSEIIETVSAYIPVDGFTEWSRRSGISESLEFMGGAVDHFGALIWSPGPIATLTIETANGDVAEVTARRIDYKEWSKMVSDTGLARDFKDAVSFERIGENAAYIRIDTFVNYRTPIKPHTVYEPIFKVIKEEKRRTLIIDLRRNGGGSADASRGMLSNFIDKPTLVRTDMRVATLDFQDLRPYLWTWDKRALNPNKLGFRKNDDGTYSLRRFVTADLKPVKPAKYAFDGQLLILTSDANSSGSTNMIAILDGLGRATTIGEKTGGSAEGPTATIIFSLTLPESNIRTRIPFFIQTNNVPSFEHGLGVTPDIEAPMTVDAFRAKRDPALEAAIALLGESE